MPAFLITAKVNVPCDGGIKLEKGTTAIVHLTHSQLPFSSIASREKVMEAFKFQHGVDISNIGLIGGQFGWKRI